MNKKILLILIGLLIILVAIVVVVIIKQQNTPAPPNKFEYVQGEIIVKFKETTTEAEANAVIERYHLSIESFPIKVVYRTVIVPIGKEQYYVDLLKNEPLIQLTGLNIIMHLDAQ